MGVEPIGDRKTCRPPVLKTGTITGPHALPRFIINNLLYCHPIVLHFSLAEADLSLVRHLSFDSSEVKT